MESRLIMQEIIGDKRFVMLFNEKLYVMKLCVLWKCLWHEAEGYSSTVVPFEFGRLLNIHFFKFFSPDTFQSCQFGLWGK